MFKKIVAAAALIAASSTAFAAEVPGVYAGVDVGSTKADNYERDEGFGAFVGYKFNENIAIEGGYHRLSDTEYRIGLRTGNVTVDQIDVSVLGTMPLSNGFSLFGRLGWNRLEADDSIGLFDRSQDSNVLYGIGLGYSFSPVISGRLEVQKPAHDITKIAVGVAYHF